MEVQQQVRRTTGNPTDGAAVPDGAAVSQILRACNQLADAADQIIQRVCTGEAENFITSNRQAGGQ